MRNDKPGGCYQVNKNVVYFNSFLGQNILVEHNVSGVCRGAAGIVSTNINYYQAGMRTGNQRCANKNTITTVAECQKASTALGLIYTDLNSDLGHPPGCFTNIQNNN